MFGVDTCGFNGNSDEELWYESIASYPLDEVRLTSIEQ